MQKLVIDSFAAVALIGICTGAMARDEIHCHESRSLTKREGVYARRDIWDSLPNAADWSALKPQLATGDVLSVTVRANGNFGSATNIWHEGITTCIKLPSEGKGQLWATAISDGNLDRPVAEIVKAAKWEGPFLRIGPAHAEERLYFQRLFGTACFETQRGTSWCFGPGYIDYGSRTYTAELVLDRIEMPTYGFPVLATEIGSKERRLWFFVRSGDAWQVFEEKLHVNERAADKTVRKPWMTLKRLPE